MLKSSKNGAIRIFIVFALVIFWFTVCELQFPLESRPASATPTSITKTFHSKKWKLLSTTKLTNLGWYSTDIRNLWGPSKNQSLGSMKAVLSTSDRSYRNSNLFDVVNDALLVEVYYPSGKIVDFPFEYQTSKFTWNELGASSVEQSPSYIRTTRTLTFPEYPSSSWAEPVNGEIGRGALFVARGDNFTNELNVGEQDIAFPQATFAETWSGKSLSVVNGNGSWIGAGIVAVWAHEAAVKGPTLNFPLVIAGQPVSDSEGAVVRGITGLGIVELSNENQDPLWVGRNLSSTLLSWQVSDNGKTGWTSLNLPNSQRVAIGGAARGKYVRLAASALDATGSSIAYSNVLKMEKGSLPANLELPSIDTSIVNSQHRITTDSGMWNVNGLQSTDEFLEISSDWECNSFQPLDTLEISNADRNKCVRLTVTKTNYVGSTTVSSKITRIPMDCSVRGPALTATITNLHESNYVYSQTAYETEWYENEEHWTGNFQENWTSVQSDYLTFTATGDLSFLSNPGSGQCGLDAFDYNLISGTLENGVAQVTMHLQGDSNIEQFSFATSTGIRTTATATLQKGVHIDYFSRWNGVSKTISTLVLQSTNDWQVWPAFIEVRTKVGANGKWSAWKSSQLRESLGSSANYGINLNLSTEGYMVQVKPHAAFEFLQSQSMELARPSVSVTVPSVRAGKSFSGTIRTSSTMKLQCVVVFHMETPVSKSLQSLSPKTWETTTTVRNGNGVFKTTAKYMGAVVVYVDCEGQGLVSPAARYVNSNFGLW